MAFMKMQAWVATVTAFWTVTVGLLILFETATIDSMNESIVATYTIFIHRGDLKGSCATLMKMA